MAARAGAGRHDVPVGALVTLDLPADSPMLSLPWIITFGPISDDEQWEPVVVGPYERPHALALAEEIVADEELMAVVEPLLPYTSVADIRAEIASAIGADEEEADADSDGDSADGVDGDTPGGADGATGDGDPAEPAEHAGPPTPEEIRAGFVRIAARLIELPQ